MEKELEKNERETLEEAAERFYPPKTKDLICSPKLVRDSFIAGAKWQKIYCAQTMLCEVKIADYGTKTNKHFTLQ